MRILIHRIIPTLVLLALATAMGCGGTKIEDHNNAVPIPNIPLAGGSGESEAGEEAAESPAAGGVERAAPRTEKQQKRPAEEMTL